MEIINQQYMLLFSICDYWLLPFIGSFILGSLLGWLLGKGRGHKETVIEEKLIYRDRVVDKEKESSSRVVSSQNIGKDSRQQSNLTTNPLISTESTKEVENLKDVKKAENPDPDNLNKKEKNTVSSPQDLFSFEASTHDEKKDSISEKIESSNDSKKLVNETSKEDNKPAENIKPSIYSNIHEDNLQIIEGVGPKMDEVLKKHGIKNWADLSIETNESLRAKLDAENPKRYRMIDPSPWPEQAKLASEKKWGELIQFQRQLGGNNDDTDAKVEKVLIKMGVIKKWKENDLKAIEGVGPKIEGLLKEAGFSTWYSVSKAPINELQAVLDKAGPRYRLAKPGTWPKQAELAYLGKWDELQEYQDELVGGK